MSKLHEGHEGHVLAELRLVVPIQIVPGFCRTFTEI